MRVPLLLEVADQPVLCVGAGPVAAAKARPLLDAGAHLTVVAPDVHPDLADAHVVHRRAYATADLADPAPRLVVAATGVPEVDGRVGADAAARGIWCLRADGRGDVATPATIRRGDALIALATGAPALTRRLREHLDPLVDDRWGEASTTLSRVRADADVRAALAAVPPAERRERWRRAVTAVVEADGGAGEAAAILRGAEV
ncbi:bifunctional precorrin-2 dehydrogenase/sirohydrochlorin ferrochelatase [Euzebya sp.]|uniref:precorrin-2 dehydrogenase/sirohydrochlorin ferrochelatase family protein n=1 Tax=Euzebya sp. TaxID=1971409 RepID=UPI0035112615